MNNKITEAISTELLRQTGMTDSLQVSPRWGGESVVIHGSVDLRALASAVSTSAAVAFYYGTAKS